MKDEMISRQAAIEVMRKAKDKSEAHRMLVQLPSAQRWISCSTALPEHDGEYLVTIKAFAPDQVVHTDIDIARYTDGKWHKAYPVVAWMPLPTPYREGGQS